MFMGFVGVILRHHSLPAACAEERKNVFEAEPCCLYCDRQSSFPLRQSSKSETGESHSSLHSVSSESCFVSFEFV